MTSERSKRRPFSVKFYNKIKYTNRKLQIELVDAYWIAGKLRINRLGDSRDFTALSISPRFFLRGGEHLYTG